MYRQMLKSGGLVARLRVGTLSGAPLSGRLIASQHSIHSNSSDPNIGGVHTHKFEAPFLQPCEANFEPLTPISFIERSAALAPHDVAVVYDGASNHFTYSQFHTRCKRLASALVDHFGIVAGDVVSVMAPNTPPMLEAHFGVPGAGAVLHTINTRLDAAGVAFQLEHAESRVIMCDMEYSGVVREAMDLMDPKHRPVLIDIIDKAYKGSGPRSSVSYEDVLLEGDSQSPLRRPSSEHNAISLCYTSGTTGNPKGVVTHHRGAFLNSLSSQQAWSMGHKPRFLWCVPMFHCNGWCFPWTVTAQGGVHICQRYVKAEDLVEAITQHKVTHMAGAPVVMSMMLQLPSEVKASVVPAAVQWYTGGAPPPPSVLDRLHTELGIHITPSYGLTEVYGPATISAASIGQADETSANKIKKRLWQAPLLCQPNIQVVDRITRIQVPPDGETLGEVVIRGNTTMKGYLRNERATMEAFEGGWFRTGDLAVAHPNGCFEIKDRAKDIIISGGENVMSSEVEAALHAHPDVLGVACVAVHDDFWGEAVCAVVEVRPGSSVDADALIKHSRSLLPAFKIPRVVIFRPLPRTITGKILKFELRKTLATEGIKGPGKKS